MALQFNPGVFDRSGEIEGSAMAKAGAMRAEGQMAKMQGIAQGVQAAAGGLSAGFEKVMLQKYEEGQLADMNLGKVAALREIGPQYGLDPGMIDTLIGDEKSQHVIAAKLGLYEQHLGQLQKNSYLQNQQVVQQQNAVQRGQITQANQANAAALRPVPRSSRAAPLPVIAPGINLHGGAGAPAVLQQQPLP
jgi:hypothetical protein